MGRLFVTGLAGYLGRAVAKAASVAGWEVAGSIHERPAPGEAETYRLDVRDAAAVLEAVRAARADAIVHTAYRRNGDDAGAVNAGGAGNVAQAARTHGARFVHVSSDTVFRGDLGRPLREDDPLDPVTDYGITKAAAEAAIAEVDPSAVLVRTSLIYGGDGSSDHERMAIDAAAGAIDATFFVDERRCPVAASDLAETLVELAGRPEIGGPLHVAGAESVNRLEFAQLIAAWAGLDPSRLRGGEGPPDRPKDLTLDSSRVRSLLGTTPRGVRAVLGA
jgi:dTDP-4-dehydrorhamnose reductase